MTREYRIAPRTMTIKTLPDDCAYPLQAEEHGQFGLSKREYFAAMAMQGILAADIRQHDLDKLLFTEGAILAVSQADALIAELNKEADADKAEAQEEAA